MNYTFADRAIADMNRRNLRAFNNLKLLNFDEINLLSAVKKVYGDSIKIAKKRYLQIAYKAYIEAAELAKVSESKAEKMADDTITEDWILDMLEDYDAVSLYQFLPEAERKQQRLVEALIAATNKNKEIDKALKLWTLQTSHYADKSVEDGTVQGYKDAGIKKVMWVAVDDEKTCKECADRDRNVYPIDNIPPKPHYQCRCILLPVFT